MASNIAKIFAEKKAYIGYLTAGDGGLDRTYDMMQAMAKGGIDIIEVGVPFSDPIADGPVIQAASSRALQHNTTLADILVTIKKFRTHYTTPIILFSYFNPIFIAASKSAEFFKNAYQSGVDGLLIVDTPLEEIDFYYDHCLQNQIDPILLLSPSTPKNRMHAINDKAKGMLYYACRKGITGVKNDLPSDLTARLTEIKANTTIPVVAGFGISDKKMAEKVLQFADGFVVGSRFVSAIAEGIDATAMQKLVQSIDPRRE